MCLKTELWIRTWSEIWTQSYVFRHILKQDQYRPVSRLLKELVLPGFLFYGCNKGCYGNYGIQRKRQQLNISDWKKKVEQKVKQKVEKGEKSFFFVLKSWKKYGNKVRLNCYNIEVNYDSDNYYVISKNGLDKKVLKKEKILKRVVWQL